MDNPPKGKHLAGIVPITGREDKLDLPWVDCLQPLVHGVLPIERAIHECALAGCDSIWVVCNDNFEPLIKKRVGDYILNPEIYSRWHFLRNKADHKKYIPVFYTPILQKDRLRRDSLGWSILQGSLSAYTVSNSISSWARPSKYFVSFPYGIYNPTIIGENRKLIRGPDSFYSSHNG